MRLAWFEAPERIREFFTDYSRAYLLTFQRQSPAAQRVLQDLAQFCHASRTTAKSNDPYQTAKLEGRREVWLRIQSAMNLSPEEQFALSQQKELPTNG